MRYLEKLSPKSIREENNSFNRMVRPCVPLSPMDRRDISMLIRPDSSVPGMTRCTLNGVHGQQGILRLNMDDIGLSKRDMGTLLIVFIPSSTFAHSWPRHTHLPLTSSNPAKQVRTVPTISSVF